MHARTAFPCFDLPQLKAELVIPWVIQNMVDNIMAAKNNGG